MKNNWYEVWCDETLDPPYVLVVLCKAGENAPVQIYDPGKDMDLIYEAPNYKAAKDWLWEDEYTRVDGRMEQEA